MDKPLSDKENLNERRAAAQPSGTSSAPDSTASQTRFGAYGNASNYNPELSDNEWKKNKVWKDTLGGRLAIRTFSRGIMGAAFFAGGTVLTRKWMKGYDPHASLSEQINIKNGGNPLRVIAKVIDNCVATPIEMTIKAMGFSEHAAANAVRFRPTMYERNGIRGRTLGDEVVNVTFDFFCASVGDAFGRDLAGLIDPNVKHTWVDKNGNINYPKAIWNAIDRVRHYVTYNGGEDWAVAIPYVYYMKAQRSIINHFSPGFIYDFDRSLNGGSFKVEKSGKKERIVGNFAQEGMLDLQGRFTAYNVGTLMYREVYNYLKSKLQGKEARLYGSPDDKTPRGISGTIADFGKWVVRSTVKGVVYMTPSVPFFWITRTNQLKHRGLFIDKEKGMLCYEGGAKSEAVHANEFYRQNEKEFVHERERAKGETYFYAKYSPSLTGPFKRTPASSNSNPTLKKSFHPFAKGTGLTDRGFDRVASLNYRASKLLDTPAHIADSVSGGFGDTIKRAIGLVDRATGDPHSFSNFTRPFINASISYTPYMMAKAEFGRLLDTGKMDKAVEDAIEGVVKMNWGEFKSGLGEIRDAMLHRTFADPQREAEAQRRIQLDQSPADVFAETEGQRRVRLNKAAMAKQKHSSWQEHLFTGRPAAKAEESHAEKISPKMTGSFSDQEALRETLAKLDPPTNSMH